MPRQLDQFQMQPARNIRQLVNNLDPFHFLTLEEREFYVPIYDELISEIRYNVVNAFSSRHTVYVTGQTGTGKTTALHFLPNDEVNEKHQIVFLNGNELFNLEDIDVIDILLLVGVRLLEEFGEQYPSLHEKFAAELTKIRKRHENPQGFSEILERERVSDLEAGVRVSFGASISKFFELLSGLGTDLFTGYKRNQTYRRITREAFEVRKDDLLHLSNEMIYEIEQHTGKALILVFNELDHIRTLEPIEQLFIRDRRYLTDLDCRKIISVPPVLRKKFTFPEKVHQFGLKVSPNPFGGNTDDGVIKRNRDSLRKIIAYRTDPSVSLITDEAIDYVVRQSGGVIRQFISILQNAAFKAGSRGLTQVTLEEVTIGARDYRHVLLHRILSKQQIELLQLVHQEHTPEGVQDENLFLEMLLGNQILVQENDDVWYMINPLIEDTLEKTWPST